MTKDFKYKFSAVLLFASALTLTSCDDWTEVESLDMETSSIEKQNPGLYADYLKDLNRFKAEDHKITMVSFDNPEGEPSKQAEHLTYLPDSIDFVCLNNTDKISQGTVKEMQDIHAKGIRSLYRIDYKVIDETWGEKVKENPELTEEDALAYIGECVTAKLAVCDEYNFDGMVIDYFGHSLVSLNEKDLALYNGRQQAFFNKISEWKDAHQDKTLIYYGNAQYLVPENMTMLSKYDFIVLKTVLSTNGDDYAFNAYLALQAGLDAVAGQEGAVNPVPADRFIVAVQLPQADDKEMVKGYWSSYDEEGNKIVAAEGAAKWMRQESVDFTRKGIFIMNVHNDYYNNYYGYVREAIRIMNPNN